MGKNMVANQGLSNWRVVSVAAAGFAFAAICCSVTIMRSGTQPGEGKWKVTQYGSGLVLRYSGGAEQTTEATVVYRDGGLTQFFPLEGKRGTVLLSPRTSRISLELIPDGPASVPVHLFGELQTGQQAPQADGSHPSVPVSIFRPGFPETKKKAYAIRTVVPALPVSLRAKLKHQAVDVQVFFKLSDRGAVTAVSTGRYASALQQEIAQRAADAALQWKFLPVAIEGSNVYADGQMQFRFLPSPL